MNVVRNRINQNSGAELKSGRSRMPMAWRTSQMRADPRVRQWFRPVSRRVNTPGVSPMGSSCEPLVEAEPLCDLLRPANQLEQLTNALGGDFC